MEPSKTLKPKLFLEKAVSSLSESCPTATQDIEENTKNRNWTIENFKYGPLNPDYPESEFWEQKADMWNTTVDHAMSARCGNCAAFDQSPQILDCIIQGINENRAAHPEDVLDRADLGYCQLFKFKCAAKRTCAAWLYGGPIE